MKSLAFWLMFIATGVFHLLLIYLFSKVAVWLLSPLFSWLA